MNFDLDDGQELIQQTLHQMMAKEFDLRWVRRVFESPDGEAPEYWGRLAELGIFGVMVPESSGGSGLGLLEAAVVADCLGYHAAPGPVVDHLLAVTAIARYGSAEQRERWLGLLLAGELRGAVALGEPEQRWTPEAWAIGGDVLDGTKIAVGAPAGVDVVVVGSPGGLSLVEGGAAGVAVAPHEPLDRTRREAPVTFVHVEPEPLPHGDPQELLDIGSVLVASDASGGARRCLDLTTEYAMGREQFGTTIASFQAVKHQLAEMAVDVLPLQYLTWYAAHLFDTSDAKAPKLASLAKARATETYVQASRRAVELHGGIGYTWACDLQFFVKRAIVDQILFGSPASHYRRVARINDWRVEPELGPRAASTS